MTDPVLSRSLRRIATDLAEGTLTASALQQATAACHDAALNAYVTWTPDLARRQAVAADAAFAAGARLGGLQGIPVSLKDLYGVAGLPTFAGTHAANGAVVGAATDAITEFFNSDLTAEEGAAALADAILAAR